MLSHTTALEAYRRPDLRRRLEQGDRCAGPCRPEAASGRDLSLLVGRGALPAGLSRPVDLLATPGSGRVRTTGARSHQLSRPLPADAAIVLAPGVLCASPEELAVEMAPLLTELELEVLLAELMGLYAIDPSAEDGMRQLRAPLTDPARVRAYLDSLGPRPGARLVEHALGNAPVLSGSPRETKLALRFSLRPLRGGYNLAVLSMNDSIEVRRLRDGMGTGVRRPDLLIGPPDGVPRPGAAPFVAVEYHGRRHDDPARLAQDAARSNELKARGVGEYVVRREHYRDLGYMDGLAEAIRGELGLARIGMSAAEADRRRDRRRELYEELERIDGVHWGGRERERARRAADEAEAWDVVPVEAYGLG